MGTTLMDEPGAFRPKSQGTSLMGEGRRGGTRLVSLEEGGQSGATDDPVVGWLVVIDGPGRGVSIPIGYGMNIVGRGRSNRIVLDFGDDRISEDDHFRVAYDSEEREFHLIPGRGTNLLRVGGKPLLAAQSLSSGTDIKVGDSMLRFVALCGPDWDWAKAPEKP